MNALISAFENSGKTIKKIAEILFFVGIVASVICAIAFGKTPDRWGEPQFNFLVFLAILVGGIICNFIASVLLYAFGDIADNIKSMAINGIPIVKTENYDE